MNFHKVGVGEAFNLFTSRVNTDCCIMEVMEDGIFTIVIFLNNMTTEEKRLLRFGKIRTRIIEEDNFILPILQFGNNLIFEIEFNPFLYDDERRTLSGKSNLVNIIGVELTDYTVQTIRLANMPKKLYGKYITSWNIADPLNFSEKYTKWIDSLRNKYSVYDLWNIGVYVGYFGEK